VRGLLKDPLMKVDRFFSQDLTQHLFETTDDFGNNKKKRNAHSFDIRLLFETSQKNLETNK
jgi:hypothetical protein